MGTYPPTTQAQEGWRKTRQESSIVLVRCPDADGNTSNSGKGGTTVRNCVDERAVDKCVTKIEKKEIDMRVQR
jgi:hypothetical protein